MCLVSLEHSAISVQVFATNLSWHLWDLCGRELKRLKEPEVADDLKKTVFPRPDRENLHMNSLWPHV